MGRIRCHAAGQLTPSRRVVRDVMRELALLRLSWSKLEFRRYDCI